MPERIERELLIAAPAEDVWHAITGEDWLADEVLLDLRPGGDAYFRTERGVKSGWVEDVLAPERLAFWWAVDGEPATRVELTLTPAKEATRLRVVETRPLDIVGTPLPQIGGKSYGPALVAA